MEAGPLEEFMVRKEMDLSCPVLNDEFKEDPAEAAGDPSTPAKLSSQMVWQVRQSQIFIIRKAVILRPLFDLTANWSWLVLLPGERERNSSRLLLPVSDLSRSTPSSSISPLACSRLP